MNSCSIIRIIENTLNYVDNRLIDHGKRVAYLVFTALERYGKLSEDEIRRAVILTLLHDIGAYKTEDIDNMVQFESSKVWEHSIYGYLFIKRFTPLSDLAPVVLFHHADCREITHLTEPLRELAQIIHIADRFDALSMAGKTDAGMLSDHFDRGRGTHFYSHLVDLFFCEGWEKLSEGSGHDGKFREILYGSELSDEDIHAYIKMIVLLIDFKSKQTVTHTFAMACASQFLAGFFDIDDSEAQWMYASAMFHDLGKINIPVEILEKAGKLTDSEMEIMKSHVVITEKILEGNANERCVRLAVRHHEKLNGKGYPYGLRDTELTTAQRIIAVADIFSALYGTRSYKDSFSKDKIIGILEEMAVNKYIDAQIVAITVKNIDRLIDEVNKITEPVIDIYNQIQAENVALMQEYEIFSSTEGTGGIS